jgi:Undecaprenyl-phosphate galactose phosphotransferase WbaP
MTHSAYGQAQPAAARRKDQQTIESPHLVSAGKRGPATDVLQSVAEVSFDGEACLSHATDVLGLPHVAEQARVYTPHVVVAPKPLWARCCKRVVDTLGAILLAIVFSPLIVAVVLILRRDGHPVIYRHRRVGMHGQPFWCLKFRTMVPDADRILHSLLEQDEGLKAEWIQNHKLKCDPRVTAIGRFLRQTSLDELPQLWNVLRGEMSLVGPRPVVREELLRYGRNGGFYLAVKPGITGLWQATGRNDTDYRRRVAMDIYYVRNHNLWLDAYILVKTTGVVIGRHGAY